MEKPNPILITKKVIAKIQISGQQIPIEIDPAISIKSQLPNPNSKIIS